MPGWAVSLHATAPTWVLRHVGCPCPLAFKQWALASVYVLASCCQPSADSPAFCTLALQIVAEFARHAPIERLRCHGRPWEGLLTMEVKGP